MKNYKTSCSKTPSVKYDSLKMRKKPAASKSAPARKK